jgi:hypothetical protein
VLLLLLLCCAQWVNNLVPFKIACEEIYVKEKIYRRGSTALQIKKMYDGFNGTARGGSVAVGLTNNCKLPATDCTLCGELNAG